MRRSATPRIHSAGFTYLGLLMLLAVIALVGAAGVKLGVLSHRRVAEQALLETGAAFGAALRSYARATPRGQSEAPRTLQDLLKDPRFPGVVRHLRRIFADPLTGKEEWGLVQGDQDEGIVAVYSLSQGRPIKLANFDARFIDFEGKRSYSEWKFTRPEEPDPKGSGLAKGLISGAVLRGDGGGGAPTAPLTDPGAGLSPGLISPQGLR